ncbi:MAG: 4-hydroxy-3-methylbut-2-enyl diphosphate reductase [Candidatus Margulisbacteria bacterium]|jgi:4-hydroxy-3-methylbut-2-enyl diphosphate reductase|nr:4-hydroxy-3-methylbut-2-enyl diphosphate reductase [Candidatus Margulisiibacteriota bacterium]
MEIVVAQHSGFCEGVERAFQIALQQAQAGQPVYMLGNLVHNKQVVDKLKAGGIRSVATVAEIPAELDSIILISAHGVPPEVYDEAKAKGLKIVDTTCPWVKRAQNLAGKLANEGCAVVIVGDKGHAEVQGLVGWSRGLARVVQTVADIEALDLAPDQCVGLIAQTTQAEAHFQTLAAAMKSRVPAVEVHNTICGATHKRQSAAVEVARQVDLMLVIGDKMSANTKRLTELCTATGTETHQIETAFDLDEKWYDGKKRIGVTGGASTPDWVIAEVLTVLRSAP